MTNQEEWVEFQNHLFENALKAYQQTKECTYLGEKQEQLNAQYSEMQSVDVEFWDKYIFEMELDAKERRNLLISRGCGTAFGCSGLLACWLNPFPATPRSVGCFCVYGRV